MGKFQPSVNWQERLDSYYGLDNRILLKVEVQPGGESVITNRCIHCGAVETITSIRLRHNRGHAVRCLSCQMKETEKRKLNEALDRKEAREQERRHNRKIVQLSLTFCVECGQLVTKGRKFCENCKRERLKEYYRIADIKRRSRIGNSIKDNDITLKKLYERDNGVCYICGRVCDWNDSEWKDGTFVVGRNYPTIEHLKPLSKGGSHTWNNIKLACLSCNSKKYNREAV